MIAVNELSSQKCNSKAVLSDLLILIAPYAPHITERTLEFNRNETSISFADLKYNEAHVKEILKCILFHLTARLGSL